MTARGSGDAGPDASPVNEDRIRSGGGGGYQVRRGGGAVNILTRPTDKLTVLESADGGNWKQIATSIKI